MPPATAHWLGRHRPLYWRTAAWPEPSTRVALRSRRRSSPRSRPARAGWPATGAGRPPTTAPSPPDRGRGRQSGCGCRRPSGGCAGHAIGRTRHRRDRRSIGAEPRQHPAPPGRATTLWSPGVPSGAGPSIGRVGRARSRPSPRRRPRRRAFRAASLPRSVAPPTAGRSPHRPRLRQREARRREARRREENRSRARRQQVRRQRVYRPRLPRLG